MTATKKTSTATTATFSSTGDTPATPPPPCTQEDAPPANAPPTPDNQPAQPKAQQTSTRPVPTLNRGDPLKPLLVWEDAPALTTHTTTVPIVPFSPKKSSASESYYVVTRGKLPGIYRSWHDAGEQVVGVPNNLHKKYKTEAEALAHWRHAKERGEIFRITV